MVGRGLDQKLVHHDGRLSLKRIQMLSSSRNALVSELAYASQPARTIRTIALAGVRVNMRESVAFMSKSAFRRRARIARSQAEPGNERHCDVTSASSAPPRTIAARRATAGRS